jgi:F-box/WD-40 domain protein 7
VAFFLKSESGILASYSKDLTVRTWDLNTLSQRREQQSPPIISCIKADGVMISSFNGRTMKILDLNTKFAKRYRLENSATSLALYNDSIITGCFDGTIKITSTNIHTFHKPAAPDPTFIPRFIGHTTLVTSLAIADEILFSASLDNTIKAWDIKTGTCIRTLENPHPVQSLATVDKKLVAKDASGTIHIYDLKTFACTSIPSGKASPHSFWSTPLLFKAGKCILAHQDELEILDFKAEGTTQN